MDYDQLFMKTNNPKTKPKTLKTFYNGTEILLIPPLLAITALSLILNQKLAFLTIFCI